MIRMRMLGRGKDSRMLEVNYVSINVMKRNLNATQVALALTMASFSASLCNSS